MLFVIVAYGDVPKALSLFAFPKGKPMLHVTIGNKLVFSDSSLKSAISVYKEWIRHSANPTSDAYNTIVMISRDKTPMLQVDSEIRNGMSAMFADRG